MLRRRGSSRRLAGTGIVIAVLLASCTNGALPNPLPGDSPERAAAELAAGLTKRDLSAVEFVGETGTQADESLADLVKGLPVKPAVTVGGVDRQGSDATATLSFSWTFAGIATPWTYTTTAPLREDGGRWKTRWQPSLVFGQLDGSNRLSARRTPAERGELLGEDGVGIMVKRPVVRIGLDKSKLKPATAAASAVKLARLVGINGKAYAARVAAAGDEAFVEAIVFRADDGDRPDNTDVLAITGALPIEDEQVLAPTRLFARPIVGTVGEASKEIIDASKGTVVAGDQVGLSGLQKRYDSQLRGTPGEQVRLLPSTSSAGSSASPSPSPTVSDSASPSPTGPVVVHEIAPVAGTALTTTLNVELQEIAEEIVGDAGSAAALVAIRPSTGAVIAAANNEDTNGQSIATVGQAPPGSTFKVISSLALLRSGLKPTSKVTCPATLEVNGARYKNYSDYPSSSLGTIELRTALAQSCNTAFIGQRNRLKGDDLASAAGSLGLGIDYDTGYPSYFGSVPVPTSQTAAAESMIGQGKVLASPMAMAAVAGSVQAGKTVIPYLIDGQRPTSTGQPLTSTEASDLKAMMRGVVTDGSGRFLGDVPGGKVIAKTGTAEYGSDTPRKTHAWMIGAHDDIAVAVFVDVGASGSRTAGPLLEKFLLSAS